MAEIPVTFLLQALDFPQMFDIMILDIFNCVRCTPYTKYKEVVFMTNREKSQFIIIILLFILVFVVLFK